MVAKMLGRGLAFPKSKTPALHQSRGFLFSSALLAEIGGPRYASAGATPRRTIRGGSIIVTGVSVLREFRPASVVCSGAATPSLCLRSSIDHARLLLMFDSAASGAHSG
jgi:hypothetical protein